MRCTVDCLVTLVCLYGLHVPNAGTGSLNTAMCCAVNFRSPFTSSIVASLEMLAMTMLDQGHNMATVLTRG